MFNTGVRPAIDKYLLDKSKEIRDYGDYWSASQAGYCMRKVIFDRLNIPPVKEDARKQRLFTAGHIFHEWIQRITKEAGLSIAQEIELQDEDLKVRGHIDDLVLITEFDGVEELPGLRKDEGPLPILKKKQKLILYDYKTQNSRAFGYKDEMSHYHKMQLGTYLYLLKYSKKRFAFEDIIDLGSQVKEARILKISKDDLRQTEEQLLWSDELGEEVKGYWTELQDWWEKKKLPPCTCDKYENGFMAREKYNPYFYKGKPCSIEWYKLNKEKV